MEPLPLVPATWIMLSLLKSDGWTCGDRRYRQCGGVRMDEDAGAPCNQFGAPIQSSRGSPDGSSSSQICGLRRER